jgi:DNA-binding MarR family transcriptional regulator
MKKPKPRRTNRSQARNQARNQARKPAPRPAGRPPVSPSPAGGTTLDTLLRLWIRPGIELEDIADELGLTMPELVALLRTEEITGLLRSLEQLAAQRHRLITLTIAPKAAACLDRVREEEEAASEQTPVTPEAIKADRNARQKRTQRRLAASMVLNHLKALNTPRKTPSLATPVDPRCIEHFQTLETEHESPAPQSVAA